MINNEQRQMKIYLDMDGVLAEFDEGFKKITNIPEGLILSEELFNERWHHFIQQEGFFHLEKHESFHPIIDYVKTLNIPVEILSSLGGTKFEMPVTKQKSAWLERHGLEYARNFVTNKKHKQNFAQKGHFLIDDHIENVEQFTEAGGVGILHETTTKTLELLEMHIMYEEKKLG